MKHYRVTLNDVLDAHREAMSYGGREGVVSLDLIQSAIGRPYSGYHRRINEKSAALLHAVVQNHGFVDGNKRTALLVTELLIRRSGYFLALEAGERFDDLIVAVASGNTAFEELVIWFGSRLKRT